MLCFGDGAHSGLMHMRDDARGGQCTSEAMCNGGMGHKLDGAQWGIFL